jgi:signal peptidase II
LISAPPLLARVILCASVSILHTHPIIPICLAMPDGPPTSPPPVVLGGNAPASAPPSASGSVPSSHSAVGTSPSDLGTNPKSEIQNPQSPLARLLPYRLLLILATATLALDQATKFWVAAHIPFDSLHSHDVGQDLIVIPGFFWLIHVGNTGAAWSMFSGQSLLLAALAFATLAAIAWWRHTLGLRERGAQLAFGLLCGGIAGNLLDRLTRGHVTDFLDFHFGSYIYPTFNVADSGICVGVFIYIVRTLRTPN